MYTTGYGKINCLVNKWSDLLFHHAVNHLSFHQVTIAQSLAWGLAAGEVLGINPSKGGNY